MTDKAHRILYNLAEQPKPEIRKCSGCEGRGYIWWVDGNFRIVCRLCHGIGWAMVIKDEQ